MTNLPRRSELQQFASVEAPAFTPGESLSFVEELTTAVASPDATVIARSGNVFRDIITGLGEKLHLGSENLFARVVLGVTSALEQEVQSGGLSMDPHATDALDEMKRWSLVVLEKNGVLTPKDVGKMLTPKDIEGSSGH